MVKYDLSAEAVVYSFLLCRNKYIYGMENALEGIREASFSLFAQNAQQELMDGQCATMNFDGDFLLDKKYEECIRQCGKAAVVIGVDCMARNEKRQMTGYASSEKVTFVEQQANGRFRITSCKSAADCILDFIGVSADTGAEFTTDEDPKDGKEPFTVLEELKDKGTVAQISKLEVMDGESAITDALTYFYGAKGIFKVEMDYVSDEEKICLTAVKAGQMLRQISELLALTGGEA